VTTKPISSTSDQRTDRGSDRRSTAPAVESQLAASVAHEINNPLDVLLNLLSLIEPEAILTQQGRQYLSLAREEVNRISEIAHTALHEFRDSPRPHKTNVPRLVDHVLQFYKSRFESQEISVKTRYCGHGDLNVYAGLLRQVLSNLVLNASDAMPQGGRLHARVAAAHEWAGMRRDGLRVTIADNGSGIPADQIAQVFEPLFTTKGDRGSGLGLSLVKDVVQKHRGVLRVRSSTRRGHSGSVFAIFLPAADVLSFARR
jgi:signal transduction histidine kinase